jgi:hypothetical protein
VAVEAIVEFHIAVLDDYHVFLTGGTNHGFTS